MGQGDYMPISHHKHKADPKMIQKIIEGGKKADAIRKESLKHHHEVDVPTAEKLLEEALKKIDNKK